MAGQKRRYTYRIRDYNARRGWCWEVTHGLDIIAGNVARPSFRFRTLHEDPIILRIKEHKNIIFLDRKFTRSSGLVVVQSFYNSSMFCLWPEFSKMPMGKACSTQDSLVQRMLQEPIRWDYLSLERYL